MHIVNITPKAKQQIKRLARRKHEDYLLIAHALSDLSNYRKIANVRPIVNKSNSYRMYVGQFRILFETHQHVVVNAIQEVKRHAT